jgi:hypothetical protein
VTDVVNHPPHYNAISGVECIDVVEQFNFNLGNVIKYVWRAGEKDDLLTDLKKARWYIEREITRLEKEYAKISTARCDDPMMAESDSEQRGFYSDGTPR